MRSFDFDRETSVAAVGEGRYRAELDTAWWVHRGPNGGYLAAIVLRALTAAVADAERAPRSLTIHYASPPGEGTLDIAARIERAGRSLTACSARLEQNGRLVGLALAAFSAPRPGPEFCDLVPPDDVPAPEDCAPPGPRDGMGEGMPPLPTPAIALRWETRWAVGELPGSGSDAAHAGGWLRLPEGHLVDAMVVAAMTDGWIPALFSRVAAPMIVPTVDLTIHLRTRLPLAGARPDDWVLATFATAAAADGFLEEDGAIWSRGGVLLAQSRQLAAMLPLT